MSSLPKAVTSLRHGCKSNSRPLSRKLNALNHYTTEPPRKGLRRTKSKNQLKIRRIGDANQESVESVLGEEERLWWEGFVKNAF